MGLLERIGRLWGRFKDLFPREVAFSYDDETDDVRAVYWSSTEGKYIDFVPPEPEPIPELPPVTHFGYADLFGPRPSLDDDAPMCQSSGLFEPKPEAGRIREIILEHGREVAEGKEYPIKRAGELESPWNTEGFI
jgi:hypothetical protein